MTAATIPLRSDAASAAPPAAKEAFKNVTHVKPTAKTAAAEAVAI